MKDYAIMQLICRYSHSNTIRLNLLVIVAVSHPFIVVQIKSEHSKNYLLINSKISYIFLKLELL